MSFIFRVFCASKSCFVSRPVYVINAIEAVCDVQLLESCHGNIWTDREISVGVVFPDVGYSTLQVETACLSTNIHGVTCQTAVMSVQFFMCVNPVV